MKSKKHGGKQLGHEGTYGVAFIPALKCNDSQVYSKGTIGKLFFSEDEANETWRIVEIIKKIDPKQKFLLYSSERCHVLRDEAIRQEPDLEKILEEKNVISSIKFQQHIMKHGGITLKQYLLENYSSINKIGRAELIYLLKNLFYAVKKLQENSFIHQDIKLLNIIISNKNRLRLIDFDLLNNTNDFYETPDTKIRDLYNGNVNENYAVANTKFQVYYDTNKSYAYNSILHKADYAYVNPPEYYLFILYMTYLTKKIQANGELGFLPHYSATNVIQYNINPKNNFEEDFIPFYDYLGLNNEDHKSDIRVFVEEVKDAAQKPAVNPVKDYWIKNKLALKSDVFSIGLLILRICTFKQNIFKDAADESTKVVNYIDSKNGPRIINDPTSKSKQINVVDAFNTLLRGLLWGNPNNRFNIKQASAWVKLICEFVEINPFTKNVDKADLVKDMKSSSTNARLNKSITQEQIDMWFKELNKTPVKKSRFTIISTPHK